MFKICHPGPNVALIEVKADITHTKTGLIARRLRAKFWPDCAIPDTSMKFGTVVDHD